MPGHPSDAWNETMDAVALREWIERHLVPFQAAAWAGEDPDAFAATVTDDYRQLSHRYLSGGYAEGRSAVAEVFTFRPYFPRLRAEVIHVAPPARAVLSVVLFDDDGNESDRLLAVEIEGGRIACCIVFDLEDRELAIASLADLESHVDRPE